MVAQRDPARGPRSAGDVQNFTDVAVDTGVFSDTLQEARGQDAEESPVLGWGQGERRRGRPWTRGPGAPPHAGTRHPPATSRTHETVQMKWPPGAPVAATGASQLSTGGRQRGLPCGLGSQTKEPELWEPISVAT